MPTYINHQSNLWGGGSPSLKTGGPPFPNWSFWESPSLPQPYLFLQAILNRLQHPPTQCPTFYGADTKFLLDK